jgi:O-antigen ligase
MGPADRLDWSERLKLSGLAALSALMGLLAGVDPVVAIAVAIGCAFVLIAFADLGLAVAVFACEPLGVGVEEANAAKAMVVILALAWLGYVFVRQNEHANFATQFPAMAWVMTGFAAWVLLSLVWAENLAATYSNFARLIAGFVVFFCVFAAVRNLDRAMLLAAAFVAGAVGAAAWGLVGGVSEPDTAGRLVGGSSSPDQLALTLVTGVALAWGIAVSARRSPLLQVGASAAGAFCLAALFMTTSRGGLIALAAMLVAAVFIAGRWRPAVIVAGVTVVLAGVFYFSALAPPEARERVQQLTQDRNRQAEGRTTIWTVGWRIVEANPVIGVGAGNFRHVTRHYLVEPGVVARSDQIITLRQDAHNTYLALLAEEGIVGFALFMALLLFCLWAALRAAANFARDGNVPGEALARALAIALVALLAASFFLDEQLNKQLWFLLALGPAFLWVSRQAGDERRLA